LKAIGARHRGALGGGDRQAAQDFRKVGTGFRTKSCEPKTQAQAVGPSTADYRPTDPQIAWHLARFIEQVRSIPADAVVLRQNWLAAYEFTSDRGAAALNDHASANDPFAKLGKQQISVEVSSVIRASPDSFRVAWTERLYENGQLSATQRWTAIPVPVAPSIDQAEQRRRAEDEAARTSRVFFQGESRAAAANGSAAAGATGPGLPGQPGASGAQDRQLAFLNAGVDRRTVAPDRVAPPASPFVLQAGSVIPAALITGIRSDLPAQISAQVTEPVYDSPTGRVLLVPQGARLIGEYSNDVGFGQRRVLLVWKRLIFPNGRSIVLERQPGADAQGYAGLQDGVDYHWWDLAKAAGLSTLLSVGAELAIDDQDRLLRALRNGGQDTINDAGQQIIRRQLTVAPTLTIRPGFPVRVLVTRDLVLEPYRG
jgi:type IV secretory pathway VirB10-like protein